MRFDDSLKTVLAADYGPGFGAQSAWRQIVDLLGRGRIGDHDAEAAAMARLAELRPLVSTAVRSASARALAFARPGADLVAFFATDDLPIAAPVLRTVVLDEAAWLAMLGRLSPGGRAVLRQRRDLPDGVVRGLESFGSTDFALHDHATPAAATIAAEQAPVAAPVAELPTDDAPPAAEPPSPLRLVPDAPLSPSPFLAVGDVTRGLPLVAEALRRTEAADAPPVPPPPPVDPAQRFEIADLVARIDAFQRDRDGQAGTAAPAAEATLAGHFRFETDTAGVIRWVEGVARAALIGVALDRSAGSAEMSGADRGNGLVRLDAGVAAAVRGCRPFADLRMEVDGHSDAAGSWRIAGAPVFDRDTGRFTGFRGTARRPMRHESAVPAEGRTAVAEGLRQLVHELRTPANAVAGFAELIETELLGPVAEPYRRRAAMIRSQAAGLLTAIDDLDTAARIEGRALELRPGAVPLGELAARLATDLAPLTRQHGATLTLSGEEAVAAVDDRAAERLMARLLATLVSAASAGERIAITVHPAGEQAVVAFDRPRRLADLSGDALFSIDGLIEPQDGGPMLGAAFTLRLVRNLAAEMDGALAIEAHRLVLRLPALEELGGSAAAHGPVREPA